MAKTYRVGVACMVHDHVWGELKRWQALPNVEIVAAGDVNAPLRERIQAEFGVPRVYSSWQEMLDAGLVSADTGQTVRLPTGA